MSATLAAPALVLSASQSHFHSGWTIGGGLEYLFAPSWSGKIEYMYADYGSAAYGAGLIPAGFGPSGPSAHSPLSSEHAAAGAGCIA